MNRAFLSLHRPMAKVNLAQSYDILRINNREIVSAVSQYYDYRLATLANILHSYAIAMITLFAGHLSDRFCGRQTAQFSVTNTSGFYYLLIRFIRCNLH